MPISPWPAQGEFPPVGDPAYDAVLTGDPLPEGAARALRPAAEIIAALSEAPAASEMAALAGALEAFRGEVGGPGQPDRPPRRRHPVLTSLGAKLAAAAVTAAMALGGTAAAAYAGALPDSVQKIAHETIGAPPVHPAHPADPATPAGPDATGPAAYGLCTAYAHLKAHGSAAQKAVAFRRLVAAAGGAAKVAAYCAAVAHPGTTPSSHPSGRPSGQPSSHPSGRPSGQPGSHPSGQPSSHPSGRPSGQPGGQPTSAP